MFLDNSGPQGNSKAFLKKALMLSSVGIEMGLSIFIGYLIGDYLDRRFDTSPYLTLFFLLIGIGAAFRGLIRGANRARK